jgi:DNA polymerase elongation subunit (family B)
MEAATTEYERKAYESKQLALKIFMNTFYGALGDRTQSGVYNPLMAGIITYTGKQLLGFVKHTCENEGLIVRYGDTDSIYASL